MVVFKPITATIQTVMQMYGFSRSEVYRRLAAGDFRALKNRDATLIVVASVDEYQAKLPAAEFRAPANTPHQAAA